MPVSTRHLVNSTGDPFTTVELQALSIELDALIDTERSTYRNENAATIANNSSAKILIVSGPGTGKSTIFKKRVLHWLTEDASGSILALSFVRKLVADLDSDIKTDPDLTDQQKQQAEVFTLHKYARSLVEQNHGMSTHKFRPHIRILTEPWTDIVWKDVLSQAGQANIIDFSFKKFAEQLHNNDLETTDEWRKVQRTYFRLSKLYNTSGFADLILYAAKAIEENPLLVKHQYFIIDEYQDFNAGEDKFINVLTQTCSGILLVGDDDQVLYDKLKSGKAAIIRNLYGGTNFTKAMLPFCGRSTFHITKTAAHFIKQSPDADCIEKIYLPISTDTNCDKIQIIGCATAPTAVDYIKKFVEDHEQEINNRKLELENGTKKDPFLLILTPAKEVNFYNSSNSNKKLMEIIEKYKASDEKFTEDYYKLLTYYSLANHPENNFTFRKILYYENVQETDINALINSCLTSGNNFSALTDQEIITSIMTKCQSIKTLLESTDSVVDKISNLSSQITISDIDKLKEELEANPVNENGVFALEHREEESAELEELEIKPMSTVELITMVGSKGLSADHVIIIGFDNQNMSWISKNAFYVAITRPRKSLQIITALASGGSSGTNDFLEKLPDEHLEFYSYKKTGRVKTSLRDRTAFVDYLNTLQRSRTRPH